MSKLLWLTSWYPNPYDRLLGDFIQRHADAVALYTPIELIHVVQLGAHTKVTQSSEQINVRGNLTEHIHVFAFRPLGISFLDKVRYNLAYQLFYLRVLKKFFREKGKPDFLHVHVPIKAGIISLAVLKKWRIPYLLSEQGSYYESLSPDTFSKRSIYFQYQTKKIFRNALAVTNVSATIGEKIEAIIGVPVTRTIHNVVDTNLFFKLPKPSKNKFRWIHVSSLSEQKNPEGMLQSFLKLYSKRNDWELVLCGPLNEKLNNYIQSLPFASLIKCTGEISNAQVARQMQLSDAFVLFSSHENFPCVIIEALCCGLPVVATNAGGIAEAINNSNGLLVQVNDVVGLAEKLNDLMENYSTYQTQEIALHASGKYNYSTIGQQFMDVYSSVGMESISVLEK